MLRWSCKLGRCRISRLENLQGVGVVCSICLFVLFSLGGPTKKETVLKRHTEPGLVASVWERFQTAYFGMMPASLFPQCAFVAATLFKLLWGSGKLSGPQLVALVNQWPSVVEAIVVEMDFVRCKPMGALLEFHLACHQSFQTDGMLVLLTQLKTTLSVANVRVLLAVTKFSFRSNAATLAIPSHLHPPPALFPLLGECLLALPRVYANSATTESDRSTVRQCLLRMASCTGLCGEDVVACTKAMIGTRVGAGEMQQVAHVLRKCVMRISWEAPVEGLGLALSSCLDAAADGDSFIGTVDEVFALARVLPPADVAMLYHKFLSVLIGNFHHVALEVAHDLESNASDTFAVVSHAVRHKCPLEGLTTVLDLMKAALSPVVGACAVICAAHLLAPHSDSEWAGIPRSLLNASCVALVTQLFGAVTQACRTTPMDPTFSKLHSAYLLFWLHIIPTFVNAPQPSVYDPLCGRGVAATQLVSKTVLPYLLSATVHPDAPRVLRELFKCPNTGGLAVRDPAWKSYVQTIVSRDLCWPPKKDASGNAAAPLLLEGLFSVSSFYKSDEERSVYVRDLVAALLYKRSDMAFVIVRTMVRCCPPKVAPMVGQLFAQTIQMGSLGWDSKTRLKCWVAYCESGVFPEMGPLLWSGIVAHVKAALSDACHPRTVLKLLIALSRLVGGAGDLSADMSQFLWACLFGIFSSLGTPEDEPLFFHLLKRLANIDRVRLWSAPEQHRTLVFRRLLSALGGSSLQSRGDACQCVLQFGRALSGTEASRLQLGVADAQRLGLVTTALLGDASAELMRLIATQDEWDSILILEAAEVVSATPCSVLNLQPYPGVSLPKDHISGMQTIHLSLNDAVNLLTQIRATRWRK